MSCFITCPAAKSRTTMHKSERSTGLLASNFANRRSIVYGFQIKTEILKAPSNTVGDKDRTFRDTNSRTMPNNLRYLEHQLITLIKHSWVICQDARAHVTYPIALRLILYHYKWYTNKSKFRYHNVCSFELQLINFIKTTLSINSSCHGAY